VTHHSGLPSESAIHSCSDPACGLRFPVAPGERFGGRCPRCGEHTFFVRPVLPQMLPPARPDLWAGASLQILLDNWRSMFNVGAVFRSADGAGIEMLHLCGITPTPVQPRLAKTALGAEQQVAWRYWADGEACARAMRGDSYELWVLEGGSESVSVFDCAPGLGSKIVLAAGHERSGVDPGIMDLASRVVHIPMIGSKGSLNVAVAVSVAVYWLRGQQAQKSSLG
jgi:23S rRNA (guanosine2251-2'-O)-methyltransferase